MRIILAMFLLAAIPLIAADRTEIKIRIERNSVNADSLMTAARQLEPRLGSSTIAVNAKRITLGFLTHPDSVGADTLKLSALAKAPGVTIEVVLPDSGK